MFERKKAPASSTGRRGWQARNRPTRCQQSHCLHSDTVRVAICCLFQQRACGDGSQHGVLYVALRSGTASGVQHTSLLEGLVQIASRLKHISPPVNTLSFLIFCYLPRSHLNEGLLSKTAQAFISLNISLVLAAQTQRCFMEGSSLFFLLFLCTSAARDFLPTRSCCVENS